MTDPPSSSAEGRAVAAVRSAGDMPGSDASPWSETGDPASEPDHSYGPRVPRLAKARLCVWLVLLSVVAYGWLPRSEPGDWQLTLRGDGCALAPQNSGPVCACEDMPAPLRRVLGVPLSLDRASLEDLQLLPGVGPRRAQAILSERSRSGAFASVAELERVPGIGPKTVAALMPLLFVGVEDPACARANWIIRSAAHRPD